MSDVDKIVGLLSSAAVEKRVAAAIVLGEIHARGAGVSDALAATLDSGIALLQARALDALARVGAKKAVPKILPLLSAREEDVRRAAAAALVSVGDDVLPAIRARLPAAGAEEKRALDAVLAELGGKDAFHVLLDGVAASDAAAAKAAALAVRQRVKDADARQRRSYLAETERFLEKQRKAGGSAGAIAAAVKILGYIEDERAVPTLLELTTAKDNAPSVRQEALIALRFLAGKKGADAAKMAAALVEAAEDVDRALAQTALHTLAGVDIPEAAMKRLEKLVGHPDLERSRFVLEMLGRQRGAESARVLVNVLATTKDKRRAEVAAACLEGRDDAAVALAKALLEADDADRAWVLRGVLRSSARRVPAPLRAQMLETASRRLAAGERNWEPLFATARDADAEGAAETLRALAHKLRKAHADKALAVLRLLCRSEGCTDDDRYALAAAELARGSHDTRPAARAGDEALRLFGALLDRGVDVAGQLRKDRSLELEHLYYVGFHFAEEGHPLGEELLRTVADRGGRAKIAKMARSKLALGEQA
jgi:HEAT repeat protein